MKTNQNPIVRVLMSTLNSQCFALEKNSSTVKKLREENHKSPHILKPIRSESESDMDVEELSFIEKLSIMALPTGYTIDFLFITPVADYFSYQFESEFAREAIRIIVPGVIIGIDILIGGAIIKAQEYYEYTGKQIQLILWKSAGIIFLSMIPLVVFSTILVSPEFSVGHTLLYIALTILSVISHVILIFNPSFHKALKYFLNLFSQWIKRGREKGIETQERYNEKKQVKQENKFKENYLNLLDTKDRLKEHNVEINLNERLSKAALKLAGEFFGRDENSNGNDDSNVHPLSKTGS